MSKYADLLKKLFSVNVGVKINAREGMRNLCTLYQDPHRHFRSIHVAGSNGKGSVSAKVCKGLQSIYKKVGLFTSPHISCFRERIQINGEMISEEDTVRLLDDIIALPGTFFELTTLLAFRYFAEQGVDAAVLETGIGGRLDATNIVVPALSIITSISLEHTAILGNTLEEIAEEKKGIIKPGVPVVLGPRAAPLILPLIAPLTAPNISGSQNISGSLVLCVEEPIGGFKTVDAENRAIAQKALEYFAIPKREVQKALTTRLPCRLERVMYQDQEIILDVAHNPDGLRRLFEELGGEGDARAKKFIVVCGLSSNKDLEGCLKIIGKHAKAVHFVKAPHVRGADVERLKEALLLGQGRGREPGREGRGEEVGGWEKDGVITADHVFCHPTIAKGLWSAIKGAKEGMERERERGREKGWEVGKERGNGIVEPMQVVVTGTFFIMSEARRLLGIEEERDAR